MNKKRRPTIADIVISDWEVEFYNRGLSEDDPNYMTKEDILDYEIIMDQRYYEDKEMEDDDF